MLTKKRLLFCLSIAGFLATGTVWHFHIGKYHIQIPIQFGHLDTPLTLVRIGQEMHLLQIDLGSKFPLSLEKAFLDKIREKKPCGTGKWKDIKGNKYEAPAYLIPKTSIGELVLTDIVAQQEDTGFTNNATIWRGENKGKEIFNKDRGSIGMPLLKKKNLLLDFHHSLMFMSNDFSKLRDAGYALNELTKISFEFGRVGIILKVMTDMGEKRLAIDTGDSINLIKSSLFENQSPQEKPKGKPGLPLWTTSTFALGNRDLGATDFYLYDITSELGEIDGFLGSPFLKKHIVYIDFENQLVYIGPRK